MPLNNGNFTATIYGGAKDDRSEEIQTYVNETLKLFGIETIIGKKNENYQARQQILMNTRNGEVAMVENMRSLEFLQERENGSLGKHSKITITALHKIREATRNMEEIKFIESENNEDKIENIKLPLKTDAEELSSDKCNILALKVWIYAVVSEEDLEDTLKPINDEDFNLLFRRLAMKPKYVGLLNLLLENKNAYKINIKSQGKKSGTALDVAIKYNNIQAIEFLREAYKS